MVKIAMAGGSGELAREVLDALVATKKHKITVLSRKDVSPNQSLPGVTWRTVDYADNSDLVEALDGIHTVLSFVNQNVADPEGSSQKRLIDACIDAGVKRFAPSEYGCNDIAELPFWAGKLEIREHLREVNKNRIVLEYTLFQPGVFMDYLASPHKTTNHITPLDTFIDFQNRRAIVVEGHEDAIMTYTAVKDIAEVVAAAIDLPDGEWPEIGGIRGGSISVAELLTLGENIRGSLFAVEKVKIEDLKAGELKTSWTLGKRHPSFTDEQADQLAAVIKSVLIGTLLTCANGAWDMPDIFNQLLPDHRLTSIEDFLSQVWDGKP